MRREVGGFVSAPVVEPGGDMLAMISEVAHLLSVFCRVLVLMAALVAPGAAQPPNVVLIIGDDQAWTDFGFMGHPDIKTPRLDALARQSAVFPRGYVPSSLCRPSLASIITGLYPQEHKITGNDPPRGTDRAEMLRHIDAVATLPRLLAARGYRSFQAGKWWEGGHERGGFTDGMTHGDPSRGGRHGDDGLKIGRASMKPVFDFIDGGDGAPFFLWYAPFLPHTPHNPPERLLAKYRDGRPEFIARYFAMCEWFDETCGALLDHLDDRGLARDTIVLFVTDNGWIQRPDRRGFAPRSKRSPYEAGVRTPIMVRWPGVVSAGEHAHPVSSVDLAPTILTACGVDVPPSMRGQDLVAVATGDEAPHGAVFGATFTHDVVDLGDPRASLTHSFVIEGGWKLIQPGSTSSPPELYDLSVDQDERRDRASEHPERIAHLTSRLRDWWPAAPPRRPNILLLVTDDQRADAMSCAGHPVLSTPRLDRLAAAGVRFTNAFVTTSICAASRATLLTSMHERRHGYTFRTPPLAAGYTELSYPRLMRQAGYRTGFVGKFGVRTEAGAAQQMFEVFKPRARRPNFVEGADGERRHFTDMIGDDAIDFLAADDERPFCLSVSFHAPHAEDGDPRQYIWPVPDSSLFEDAEIPQPANAAPEFFEAQPEFLRRSLNRVRWRWRFDSEDKRQQMTRGYYRMIAGVDRVVGRVLDHLEERGLEEETVVIFTSDNGYFLGERGFAGKWLIHEESIRVPLVVFDPRAPSNRRGITVDPMVLNLDLAPTILDLAGVAVPGAYQGRSLSPWLQGEFVADWRTDFLYEHLFDHREIPKSSGVRQVHWSYVNYFEQSPPYEELYDLVNDPTQTRNLASDPERADVLAAMRARREHLLREIR